MTERGNVMHIIPEKFPNLRAVKKKDLINIFWLFCLVMPDDFFGEITLYASKTPNSIAYKWLDYRFGIVSAIILVLGLCLKSSLKRNIFVIAILMLGREILFFIVGLSSCFSAHAYEIYIVLLLGACIVNIVCEANITLEDKKLILWRAIFVNIVMVYISFLFHMNGIANRYNAPNMDVEATGVICGVAFVFCLFHTNIYHRYMLALIAFGGLILSGSRVNLLITVLAIVIGMFNGVIRKRGFKRSVLTNMIFFCYALTIILIVLVLITWIFGINISFLRSDIVKRMIDAASFFILESDSSVLGRSRSLEIGLKIVTAHPFGISGFFTNLQLETQKYGFPTFPHSTFITYYILIGPIIIFLIIWMLRLMFKAFKMDCASFLEIFYLFLFFCISGGPIVSFKPIFFYMFLLETINLTINNKQSGNRIEDYT